MSMERRIPRVEVEELVAEPARFTAQRIEVAGVLQSQGSDAPSDPRLVLRDEDHRTIPVTPWLPPGADTAPRGPALSPPARISEYLGREVVLAGTWDEDDGEYILRVETGNVAGSPARRLTPDEIASASGVGGVGIRGRGVLHGWLHVRRQRVVLVTAHPGTRQEVCFGTDLHEGRAMACEGERIAISGIIRKLSPWSGTITGARLGRLDSDLHYTPGQYVVLTGVVEHRVLPGAEEQAPPSGSWLVLPRSIHLDRLRTKTVYLRSPGMYPDGYSGRFHGRLATRTHRGARARGEAHALLTGISDLRTGEPIYDGNGFRSAVDGAALRALLLPVRQRAREPTSVAVVLEPDQETAHVGVLGGPHAVDESPFQGFHGQAPIAEPAPADRKAIRFDEQGRAFRTATGKPLRVLAPQGGDSGSPDAPSRTYLFDPERSAVYQVLSGDAAGTRPRLERVIRIPRS